MNGAFQKLSVPRRHAAHDVQTRPLSGEEVETFTRFRLPGQGGNRNQIKKILPTLYGIILLPLVWAHFKYVSQLRVMLIHLERTYPSTCFQLSFHQPVHRATI